MPQLTEQGRRRIDELAQRYAVSTDAVMTLLQALVNTNGTMAQFNHPELGGGGQWMLGGMTMVGDMFNHGLKSKVDGLCSELSQLLAQQPFVPVPAGFQSQSQGGGQQPGGHAVGTSISLFVPEPLGRASGQWWPAELGSPNGGGGQWMRGGMTMVGDMFNGGLQATVSGLCSELSSLLASQQVFAPLPFGVPSSAGHHCPEVRPGGSGTNKLIEAPPVCPPGC